MSELVVALGAALLVMIIVLGLPEPTTDDADCVIITPYGTVLYDPVVGEDTGTLYCEVAE